MIKYPYIHVYVYNVYDTSNRRKTILDGCRNPFKSEQIDDKIVFRDYFEFKVAYIYSHGR